MSETFSRPKIPFLGVLIPVLLLLGVALMMLQGTRTAPTPPPDDPEQRMCQMAAMAVDVAEFTIMPGYNALGELDEVVVVSKRFAHEQASASFILEPMNPSIAQLAQSNNMQIPATAWTARVFNNTGTPRLGTFFLFSRSFRSNLFHNSI